MLKHQRRQFIVRDDTVKFLDSRVVVHYFVAFIVFAFHVFGLVRILYFKVIQREFPLVPVLIIRGPDVPGLCTHNAKALGFGHADRKLSQVRFILLRDLGIGEHPGNMDAALRANKQD